MRDRPADGPLPWEAWDWCPLHACWYAPGRPCPQCLCDASQAVCPADFGEPCPDCEGCESDFDPDDAGLAERCESFDREAEARASADFPGWYENLMGPADRNPNRYTQERN